MAEGGDKFTGEGGQGGAPVFNVDLSQEQIPGKELSKGASKADGPFATSGSAGERVIMMEDRHGNKMESTVYPDKRIDSHDRMNGTKLTLESKAPDPTQPKKLELDRVELKAHNQQINWQVQPDGKVREEHINAKGEKTSKTIPGSDTPEGRQKWEEQMHAMVRSKATTLSKEGNVVLQPQQPKEDTANTVRKYLGKLENKWITTIKPN